MCYSVKMSVKIFKSQQTNFLVMFVLFFVFFNILNCVMLQSLEDAVVNETVLSLAGLQSWHSLSYGRFQVGDAFTQVLLRMVIYFVVALIPSLILTTVDGAVPST